MAISITRTQKRIISWVGKKRACGRMQHLAANILRLPDEKRTWNSWGHHKAKDPNSEFYVVISPSGERDTNFIVFDGENEVNLSHDNLMAMDRASFDKLLELLEQQNALAACSSQYHEMLDSDADRPQDYPEIDFAAMKAAAAANA